ncbi:GAF domain-containing sensor histidine kinase [Haloarculaceae archaeon H-GB2-1]|nr:GAF domain-containing sensor histidine kinase [Haloarculaceae archaeon H-GB1-1]MEA5386649.1 GAF domain-containing sensor histidine kinase [Haloarculaceae archaeon H-GB11]MEA5408173.1 GAF domain-containing sensor histidine kinase [Haloarculaceae archaeon H-GB2-1]
MSDDQPELDRGPRAARNQLYAIMDQDTGLQEKADRALAVGKSYLGAENGHLTYVDPALEHWEAIASTDSDDGTFPPGLTLDLDATYCRRTVEDDACIALHDAPNQGWDDDPAFQAHGLHCYHGVPVTVGESTYGTVCFVSESPRDEAFTRDETMFAELIGYLLGQEIERSLDEAKLTERQRLVEVLNRVFRHNLRNKLTVVRGNAEYLHSSADHRADRIDAITQAVEDLLETIESARELGSLVMESRDPLALDVEAISIDVATQVRETFPEASIGVEGAGEGTATTIRASPILELALRELVENAVKHGGSSPSVTISFAHDDRYLCIHVTDDGPGLPENERRIIRRGDETPLRHGNGLGLWLVQWTAQRLGGDVDASVSSAGTTITLRLPYGPTRIESVQE